MSHGTAESGGRVGEAEVHDFRLIEAERCFERCFPSIFLFDAYIIVSPSNVEFGEE